MKNLMYALCLIVVGNLYGQDTIQANQEKTNPEIKNTFKTAQFSPREATIFSFNNEELHFTPGENEILITRNLNGVESPFATLRQTTDDGFFIMTSPISDDISYGRFDKDGNFKSFRYDIGKDEFIEEIYTVKKPIQNKTPVSIKLNTQ